MDNAILFLTDKIENEFGYFKTKLDKMDIDDENLNMHINRVENYVEEIRSILTKDVDLGESQEFHII